MFELLAHREDARGRAGTMRARTHSDPDRGRTCGAPVRKKERAVSSELPGGSAGLRKREKNRSDADSTGSLRIVRKRPEMCGFR